MFESILVANRGEIAVRIIRAAREMGIRTIAIFSDADEGALWTRRADQSCRLGPAPARERWIAACHAIRDWARSNPHEYALVYGSPVPGYRAPEATIGPASRVPLAFAGVVRDALAAGELAAPREALPVTGALAGQAAALSAALAASAASPESSGAYASVPPDALVRAVIAWTQLFGMISFELFGQFVGSFEPADALFAYTVAQLTAFVGLREASTSTGSGTPGTPAATLEA